jgi:hypothetical protein
VLAFSYSCVVVIVLLANVSRVGYVYTNDEAVVELIAKMVPFVALFHVRRRDQFDASRQVSLDICRSLHRHLTLWEQRVEGSSAAQAGKLWALWAMVPCGFSGCRSLQGEKERSVLIISLRLHLPHSGYPFFPPPGWHSGPTLASMVSGRGWWSRFSSALRCKSSLFTYGPIGMW